MIDMAHAKGASGREEDRSAMEKETKPTYTMFFLLSGGILIFLIYYYAYPMWAAMGLSNWLTDRIIRNFYLSGTMDAQMPPRLVCLLFASLFALVRSGNSKHTDWKVITGMMGIGLVLFFGSCLMPPGLLLVTAMLAGYLLYLFGAIALGRLYRSFDGNLPDYWDTFPQCEKLIENEDSINIPMTYQYKGHLHKGYINVVSPQRGTMVLGTPGSGKTKSIYGPYIRGMIQKAYSLCVYDYKAPGLTELVLNELLDNYNCYKVKPKMYVVNFDDPLHSHRFNPIHPRYLEDPVDSTEIAEIILKNANRGEEKNGDFFSLSARCYVDLLIWFLKIYKKGRYCTFPHLIELMGQDYRNVLDILMRFDELEVKRNTFIDAMKDKAFEQLQGQIASARVPLNRFSSKTLYWTLSGDDFSLDINNPEDPKILCIANNPRRQSVYGTTLALMMSQLFKQINVPGRIHCGVLIDELPTIYLKDLSHLIDTGRENKVAVVVGAQDKSQLVRDYDKKESDVIFNTVGNVFAGSVKGETAENLSKSFGKVEKESRSIQQGDTSEHLTISYQLKDVLPPDKIEALSQGSFCGYVADTYKQKIHPKVFCGEIDAGEPPKSSAKVPRLVDLSEVQMRLLVEQNYRRIRQEVANFVQEELCRS